MSNIVYLHHHRPIKRIPPAVQQTYSDVRVEFARRIENRLYEMEAPDIAEIRRIGEESCLPSDTEQKA